MAKRVEVNDAAVKHARQLIRDGKIDKESDWSEAQPSASKENAFLEKHDMKEYGEWYLGLVPGEDDDNKGHYSFPYGDFKQVHRDGVIAARQRAAQNHHPAVEKAAGELLELIDKKTGNNGK
ncbi:hypothetical protein [Aggregatilinea lenta]|uniref:hypothetical protein n=1 Tax=Aggregatilinea lenta TaxID=913108 RepID=UPI000E5AE415|nr:hypothetical protein [Aggregatilinea lenta]